MSAKVDIVWLGAEIELCFLQWKVAVLTVGEYQINDIKL
jgi:hypothetical protein